MPPIPLKFVGNSATGRSLAFDSARSVNLYQEAAVSEGAQAPVALLGTAGLAEHVTVPELPIRGQHVVEGRVMAAIGGALYEIYSDGTAKRWASLSTIDGDVGMSDNAGLLVIGEGTGFSTFDFITGILSPIVDTPFGTWSAYIDGYTLFLERDTGFVYPSVPDDPTLIDFLARFNAESDSDAVVQIVVNGPEVWLFGRRTIEVFYNSGDSDNIFQRISSARIEQGCVSARSALRFDNSLAWVGADIFGQGIVWRATGYSPQRISTHAVEVALARVTDLTKITAICWQEDGHSFYQLNLEDTSWVYDAATREWHERAWWNTETGEYERHRADHHSFAYGLHLVGDYQKGTIYRQSVDLYTDAGNPLRALRRVSIPNTGLGRIVCNSLQVDMETGLTGVPDPRMTLRVSYDGGRTWGNERSTSIGKIGETTTRAIFRRLGQGRDWAFEISIADAVPRRIFGGQAMVEPGTS